jgi:RNA-directed DNA polymerase
MTQKILEAIYEPLFKPCSYGFRPGRGCHDAIKELQHYLWGNEVETVIDLDLGNFFGTIDHKILEEILREKIKDPIFMRYIIRMFKSGTLKEGDIVTDEEGVPQGNIASPVMANIYAHYAIDVWIEEMVQPMCKGKIKLYRYADDAIICCEKEDDAQRIMKVMGRRLERFKLRLNEEKTEMVSFSKRKMGMGIKQGTFDFLGFTFYLGRSKRNRIIPKLRTSKKRLRSKLAKVKEWLKTSRNRIKLRPLWKTFNSKLRGHNQYYGVSHNSESIQTFFYESRRLFFKWINRRSQRKSFNGEMFQSFLKRYPAPKPRIYHRLF